MADLDLTDKTVLIGSLLSTKNLVAGSRQMTAACGHDVFVAPSGRAFLADAGDHGVLICMQCALALPEIAESLKEKPLAMTAAQRAEIEDEIGEAATNEILNLLGVKQQEVGEG